MLSVCNADGGCGTLRHKGDAMKIFVVRGTTGEYSDRTEWPVKAFLSEKAAQELVIAATQRANEVFTDRSYDRDIDKNQFDPDMRMDYTGTSYMIETVELDNA